METISYGAGLAVRVFPNLRMAQLIYSCAIIYVLLLTDGEGLNVPVTGFNDRDTVDDDIAFRRALNSDFPGDDLIRALISALRDGEWIMAACIAAAIAMRYYISAGTRESVNYLFGLVLESETLLTDASRSTADFLLSGGVSETRAQVRTALMRVRSDNRGVISNVFGTVSDEPG